MNTLNGFKYEADTDTVVVDGYLTEEKLLRLMVIWAGAENVMQQFPVVGTRMKYDAKVTIEGDKTFVVEFDGDSHFRDANVIYRDELKDKTMWSADIPVLRVPYFVQLDNETFEHFFIVPFNHNIRTECKHGFTETTKMLPASFCSLGMFRYKKIMASLPEAARVAVLRSLEKRADVLPRPYVYGINFDCQTID